MSLSDHPRAYGTAALIAAFVAGIAVTLGFKDLYPDVEKRYQRKKAEARLRRGSLFFIPDDEPVRLEDHESALASPASSPSTAVEEEGCWVEGIEGAIGNTPLVLIRSLSAATGCLVLAKAEFLNAAGNSPKDRVALSMIRDAEARGLLVPSRGDTIYEGTVGSTGISIAALARARGYRAHICMPDDQSVEKVDLLTHLGAAVERVPVQPIASPEHFVNVARRRAAEHTASAKTETESRGFFADQFESEANWRAHYRGTGPEIWRQTGGRIDAFVSGAGTGGTIAGSARYLKEMKNDVKIVLADPHGSGLYNRIRHGVMYSSTEREGTRRRQQVDTLVEGIGINRVTANLESGRELIDDAVRVTDEQALEMARWLVEHDGIFAGSSTAVNCVAAVVTAMKLPKGSMVVTVLCDSGTRHLSKFYKQIAEMGLEEKTDEMQSDDLLATLGLQDLRRKE